ncbi:hypothetical protein AB0G04_43985 [Actinoplanes sp. NPDC023801]|uniref:RCC1 domain-containing protein n=1 Tax=Actinoplanes sp. NPDC023801 TaxID=3154595 RepID=UPI0033C3F11F
MRTTTMALIGPLTMLAAMMAGPAAAEPSDHSAAPLTAGGSHTCGLAPDAKAYCWGYGGYGQLGNGGTSDRAHPVAVDAPAGAAFTHLTAGGNHTCGLARDGKAYCWGQGDKGRLGDSGVADQVRPVAVHVPTGVAFTQLTAGDDHTCGLARDGKAYCWGRGDYGRLGNNGVADQSKPVAVHAPTGVAFTQLTAGGHHTCGVARDGKAYCWGRGAYGLLGIDNVVAYRSTPVAVHAPAGMVFVHLTAGDAHTCGLGNDTKTYCWGEGASGALGDGGTANRLKPVAVDVPAGVTFTRLAAGEAHTCGLGGDARTYCWGDGYHGRLGNSSDAIQSRPVAVDAPAGVTFTRLAAGDAHTCALGDDTKTYCWGFGYHGRLGNSSVANQSTPVAVDTPAG